MLDNYKKLLSEKIVEVNVSLALFITLLYIDVIPSGYEANRDKGD